MKASTSAIMAAAGASSASASAMLPIPFFNTTATSPFKCPAPFGAFCVGPSMSQNLLITCEAGNATPVNCIEQTADAPPIDDYNARCWESTPTAGDGACAKASVVYPMTGPSFPLPDGEYPALPDIPTISPMAGIPTAFPIPANLTQLPRPAETHSPLAPSIASMPLAVFPPYVTTVTLGTATNFKTIYSNCGNGTMLYASTTFSYASWQTNSIPGELGPSADQQQGGGGAYGATMTSYPVIVSQTIPCATDTAQVEAAPTAEAEPSESVTSTVSWEWTPTGSAPKMSWVHQTAYTAPTPTGTALEAAATAGPQPAGGDNGPQDSNSSASGSAASSLSAESSATGKNGAKSSSSFDQGHSSAASSVVRAPSSSLLVLAIVVVAAMSW